MFRVDSFGLFAVICGGSVMYFYVLFEVINSWPAHAVRTVLYCAVGIVVVVGLWISMIDVTIGRTTIVRRTLFGFGRTTTFETGAIRRLLVKPDSTGRPTRVTIEFNDGRRLQLTYFQRNFLVALDYLRNTFDVPVEIQSIWA